MHPTYLEALITFQSYSLLANDDVLSIRVGVAAGLSSTLGKENRPLRRPLLASGAGHPPVLIPFSGHPLFCPLYVRSWQNPRVLEAVRAQKGIQ